MPHYIVRNTRTEVETEHGTWGAAMRAADRAFRKAGEEYEVVVIERDLGGEERIYDTEGRLMDENGHFPPG